MRLKLLKIIFIITSIILLPLGLLSRAFYFIHLGIEYCLDKYKKFIFKHTS